jgi:hypothetical protein
MYSLRFLNERFVNAFLPASFPPAIQKSQSQSLATAAPLPFYTDIATLRYVGLSLMPVYFTLMRQIFFVLL